MSSAPKTLDGVRSAVRRLLGESGHFYVSQQIFEDFRPGSFSENKYWSASIYGLGGDPIGSTASTPAKMLRELEKKLLAWRAAQIDRRIPKLDGEPELVEPKRINGRIPKRIEYRGSGL